MGSALAIKGNLTKLFAFFFENGLHLVIKPRKNMKKKPVEDKFNRLINKRAVVESVFDILSTVGDYTARPMK